ncbi:hypothetical protein SDC9_133368 [bioreactor metagenome]|uniref:Uncharacterized protein n=1 Tax=bioreactor metagenome TaxID=1076179 RepID=A0A645DAQ9_9ZZZZ
MNYNLKKPAQSDFYNVEDFNDNMDIIDGALNNAGANKIDKVTNGTAGNMAVLTVDGGIADGGLKFSIYNGGLRVTYDDGE